MTQHFLPHERALNAATPRAERSTTRAGAAGRRPLWAALARSAIIGVLIAVAPIEALAGGICSAANVNAVLDTGQRPNRIDKRLFYRHAEKAFPIYDRQGRHFAGTDAILDYWNAHPELKDDRWLAYVLATAYHETAFVMFPVRETLADTDEEAIARLARSNCCKDKTYWRIIPETGKSYFGRGYVQLTWDFNYKRADQRFGITERSESYYWNPEFALDPVKSIQITYDGMVYGWYTGKCLLEYFQPNRREDWRNARRIINGLDRANDIGEHAVEFLASIRAAQVPATFQETREAEQSGALGEGIEALKTQDAALAKSIADLETLMVDRIDALETQLANERTRFETVTLANQRLASDMAASRQELSESRREIEASRADLAQTRDEIAETRNDIAETRTQIETARGEIDQTRADIQQARDEIAALRGDMTAVRAELRGLPTELELSAEDQERLVSIERGLDDAGTDRRLNRDAIEALERQIGALATQLDDQNQRFALVVRELERANNRTLWNYMFGDSE